MPSPGLLGSVEDVGGEAVVNSSSNSNNMAGFEAGVSSEEARTPLLNEETATGGVEEGREEDNGDELHRDAGEGGGGTIYFEDGRNDPLDQADVAYGSDSFMAVVKPVALTMTLSAAITASLYADATGAQNSALSVYEVYDESSTLDPSSVRLGKSLVNAFIIVAAIAAVTVVIVVMYWMRCMKCLLGYMAISSVVLLGTLGGAVWATALEVYQIPCDVFTYYGVLWNFAVVGVIAIFYQKGIPTAVTQAYLVATSVIMAWHLSRFEEWTGWCLLVVLALYDLCAVLSPCGPLKALLHLMQEYDEPMPGLLYEAELPGALRRGRSSNEREAEVEAEQPRAEEEQAEGLQVTVPDEAQALIRHRTGAGYGHGDSRSEGFTVGNPNQGFSLVAHGSVFGAGGRAEGGARGSAGGMVRGSSVTDTPTSHGFVGFQGAGPQFLEDAGTRPEESDSSAPQAKGAVGRGHHDAPPSRPSTSRGFLTDTSALESRRGRGGGGDRERVAIAESLREDADGMVTLDGRDDRSAGAEDVNGLVMVDGRGAGARETGIRVLLPQRDEAVEGNEGVTREATYERASIKLGLGDFIFYSVLVSKAALYSFTAWAASAVVILFGLGTTLVLLAVYRMALPALPISIGLGTVFYLVTRLSMQPFVEALNEAPLYF